MKKIELKWSKPVQAASIGYAGLPHEFSEEKGVYMWCVRTADHYVATYVGKADKGIEQRLNQETAGMRSGKASLYRLVTADGAFTDSDFFLEYIPGYDSRVSSVDRDLIERNMAAHVVMVAPADSWRTMAFPVEVEGAIQIHLRRDARTRMYLTTGVSDYRLNDVQIVNQFPAGIRVLGMDETICIPRAHSSVPE